MLHHALLPALAALAVLAIGITVLRQGPRNPVHRTFALVALACAAWNLDIAALDYFADPVVAEWWSRLLRIGVCFAPPAMLHLALVLYDDRRARWRQALTAGYWLATALAVLNLAGGLVRGVRLHVWGWYIQPTPLYSILTATLVVYSTLFLLRMWQGFRHPLSPRQRTVTKFWLLGSAVQLVFVATNLLTVYGINVYPMGSVGTVFWVGLLGYAIARHRVIDVDYAVRKGMSFAMAMATVLVPGSLVLGVLATRLGTELPALLVVVALLLALLVALLTPGLQKALETRLHRVLFPSRYDYRSRLRQLAGHLVHIVDRAELVGELGAALHDVLDVERVEIFVRHDAARQLVQVYPPTIEADPLAEDVSTALGQLLRPTLVDELHPGPTRALFRGHGWEAGIPLRVAGRLTGFVGVGINREFKLLSKEDLVLLEGVAAGASAALENMRLARRLRRSEQELERASRLSSLGMLAAGLAHEIRNPLVAVKTFLDLLPSRLDDREFLTGFRDLSLSELRRVTDLLSDLLALGKSTTAQRTLVDLARTIEPVLRLMASTARKRQVELVVRHRGDLPPVLADPDQLKQITLNLVLNAIEVSPPGSEIVVELRAASWGGLVLEVRDHGTGIPSDQVENIFSPFFTTKEAGTGLGLALTHQMVVEHGGDIAVETVEGRGSVFRVTLPQAPEPLRDTGT